MNTIKATLVLTALALASLFFGCSTTTTTRTEKDSTYTIEAERIVENNLPGLGMSLFHQPTGWSYVPITKTDSPIPVLVFHKDKTRTAKSITAVYNPKDSTLSIDITPKDTSVTQTTITNNNTEGPSWSTTILKDLGIAFVVILLLVFLFFGLKSFAASSPTGIIGTILGLFKKK